LFEGETGEFVKGVYKIAGDDVGVQKTNGTPGVTPLV